MKTITASIAIATLGLSLAACSSTASPAKDTVKHSESVKQDSYTTTLMQIAWNAQSGSDQRTACVGWNVAPEIVYQGFVEGAGPETMATLSEKDVKAFLNKVCA